MDETGKPSIQSTLRQAIEEDYKKLRATFESEPQLAMQILVRRLDVVSMFLRSGENENEDEANEVRGYFDFGWAPAMKLFLDDHGFDEPCPFIQTFEPDYQWADAVMLQSGRLALCRQFLEHEKAGLVEFANPAENEFEIKLKANPAGPEYFERRSFDFFREQILERMIEEKKSKQVFDDNQIKAKLRQVISNPQGKFISYATTAEIDEHYDERGHYHALRIQGRDDFDPGDMFGGIEYRKYSEMVEILCGVALMHTDACIELAKMNPEVDMHDILTYLYHKDKTVKIYSDHLGVSSEEIEQILSCLTLHKDNYEHHLSIPAAAVPPYLQISENQLIRSVRGCLGNPFKFLNAELKRKHKKDYDIAVNNREERFRKDLFGLLPQEGVVKIPKGINISLDGMRTDIDAVAYDTRTKTLGLFQLKWQDLFAHSMKERFSRISNLFPKANEWIGKVEIWSSSNDAKAILNSLQITKYAPEAREINDICVFVLARNHVHFTGIETGERVAWGSWYQLIESMASVRTDFDDPIKEMFVKLRFFAPGLRTAREEMPARRSFDAKIGDYEVHLAGGHS